MALQVGKANMSVTFYWNDKVYFSQTYIIILTSLCMIYRWKIASNVQFKTSNQKLWLPCSFYNFYHDNLNHVIVCVV